MANVNVDLKNAAGKYTFKKFRGVDENVISSDEPYAEECTNFRIMADGTLKKRCGFRRQGNLPYAIRAFWDGYVGGVRYCFALAGNGIYNVNYLYNTHSLVGTVSTSSGSAEFFFYSGLLYLMDGESVYAYMNGIFSKTTAYIPLYGDGWSPFNGGKICENINYLTPYVRIRYVMESDADTTYSFPFDIESLYKIYVDGIQRPNDHLKLGTTKRTALLLTANVVKGSEVILYLKLADFKQSYPLSSVISCKRGVVHGFADSSRLFLYDGDGDKRRIFRSRYVHPESFAALKAQESTASNIYFTENCYLDVGDGDGGITSMVTYDNKLFIFTDKETWYAECDSSEKTTALPISSTFGCVSVGAAVAVSDGVITVMPSGVYKITVSGSSKNVFSYKKISDPISRSVSPSFLKLASTYYCAARDELWISMKDGGTGNIWIYDARGNWFCFSGMKTSGFRDIEGDVGFCYGTMIFACQESLCYDIDYSTGAQKEIIATWKSKPIDFSKPERKKKLLWATLQANTGDDIFELELFGDNGGYISFDFMGSSSRAISTFSCRPKIGRFRYAQVGVNTGRQPKVRIIGITLAISGR